MKFCDKLCKLRKANNLSQEQLATKLGLSRQAISKWESGTSYPDMGTIMELCKLLNCELYDLIDDSAISDKRKIERTNINDWIQDLLKFITKSYNMCCSMKFLEKMKCLFELAIIFILLLLIWLFVGEVFAYFIIQIFYALALSHYKVMSILQLIYLLFGLLFGGIVFIHLFKIRYLDYYITVEDNDIKTKEFEKPISDFKEEKTSKFIEKQKEKVIIRDAKHSSYSFFTAINKIIVFGLKTFSIITLIPLLFLLLFGTIILVTCMVFIKYGLLFLFLILLILGSSIMLFSVCSLIYKFIFNLNQKYNKTFIIFSGGLILTGVGIGLTLVALLNYEEVNYNLQLSEKATSEKTIEVKEEILITNKYENFYDYKTVLYLDEYEIVIDNNVKDLDLKVYSYEGYNCTLYHNINENTYDIYYNEKPLQIFKIVFDGIKNKKIYQNNEYKDCKAIITISEENYKKIKFN